MDEDLKLAAALKEGAVWHLSGSSVDIAGTDELMAQGCATITRLHASRTAYQDTIDGLVKERDKARAEIADLDIQLFTARGKVLTAILRAETAEAQRDAALEALDNLIVVMSLEHARTCAARICDCDLDDTREHSLRSARAASRAIGGGET